MTETHLKEVGQTRHGSLTEPDPVVRLKNLHQQALAKLGGEGLARSHRLENSYMVRAQPLVRRKAIKIGEGANGPYPDDEQSIANVFKPTKQNPC